MYRDVPLVVSEPLGFICFSSLGHTLSSSITGGHTWIVVLKHIGGKDSPLACSPTYSRHVSCYECVDFTTFSVYQHSIRIPQEDSVDLPSPYQCQQLNLMIISKENNNNNNHQHAFLCFAHISFSSLDKTFMNQDVDGLMGYRSLDWDLYQHHL